MSIMIPTWVNGQLVPVEKLKAHQDGLLHKAVSVFMICGSSILIQRRALAKYHTPGLWANTCCTHPFWDEPAIQCAKRRMKDELGIADCQPVFRDKVEYRADVGNGLTEHERVSVFSAHVETPPQMTLNQDEVMGVRWVDYHALKADVQNDPDKFTPWLKIYLDQHSESIFDAKLLNPAAH